MRVMFHLLQTGELERGRMEDYLSLTLMMHELTTIYDWQSVLDYDIRYRELQAQYEFRWGVPCKHLEDIVLQRRPLNPPAGAGRGQGNGGHPRGGNQRPNYDAEEKCRLYLKGDCPYGADCRYQHKKSE